MRSFDSTTGQETWITPRYILSGLGDFDLDPCSADIMPYRTARRMVTKRENGLSFDWGDARVRLNPPYGKQMPKFLEKMRRGIGLLPVRTDTKWFHELVLPRIVGIFFMKGRIRFLKQDGTVGGSPAFASMLCAYSRYDAVSMIFHSKLKGAYLDVNN